VFYFLIEKNLNFRVRNGSLPFEDFRLAGLGLISSVNKILVNTGTPNIKQNKVEVSLTLMSPQKKYRSELERVGAVLRIRIRCFFDPWIRDPEWEKRKDPDPGSKIS
jgi:hypothetical protein